MLPCFKKEAVNLEGTDHQDLFWLKIFDEAEDKLLKLVEKDETTRFKLYTCMKQLFFDMWQGETDISPHILKVMYFTILSNYKLLAVERSVHLTFNKQQFCTQPL